MFLCGGRGDLRCPSEEGKDRIIEAAKERQRLNDKASSSIIEKILPGNGQEIPQFKYHYQCYSKFTHKGKIERLRLNKQESIHDPCLDKLCNDIVNGLADGHVYDMGCVWSQYVKSCSMQNVNIPQKYQSRKNSFYDGIKKALGEQASFARPINQQAHLLIYWVPK